ncbi:MAG: amino acid adenylation domain-containing protein [Lachnospiraceae bacterium]|nr:amino acid adenylation domain-containing protein [Lachnospiraceae bacterium]
MSMVWKSSPVSMTELGIYLEWQKNPQGTAYNIPLLMSLPEGTDLVRLRDALKRTLRAHACVLSHFHKEEDGSVIRMTPYSKQEEISVNVIESVGEPKLQELIRPFADMEHDLYRLHIIKGREHSYLFVDFHHILFDGMSIPVLIRELNRTYSGEEPLGETVTVADFAKAEQEKRETAAYDQEGEWYEKLLSGVEICSTPIHDKYGQTRKNSCFTMDLEIDGKQLSKYTKSLGIKTSTFFTGVFGYVLSRFSGNDEVLFASVHSGREEETLGDIGMFAKTFPVYELFTKEDLIVDHLKALDDQLGKSRSKGLFSYADICDQFHLSIPTLFCYQGSMENEIPFLQGKVIPKIIQSDTAKEEMVAEIFRSGESYRLRISYSTDLFEEESLKNFAYSYERTAQEFISRESFGLVDITSEKQRSMLDSFLALPSETYAPENIVTLFREQAKKRPEAVALVFKSVRKTYGEINEASDRIAYALMQKGIGRGKVVSVLIHRNEFMVIASLGVLKSGAGYQPLDPAYPSERLNFMVKDASASLVIADEDLIPLLNDYSGEFLLTQDVTSLPEIPANITMPVADGDDLLVLLYTSGSTGVPKGLVLTHSNLSNFCKWYQKEFNLTEDTVHAAYASYGFDANMMDMYPALISGGCVCVVPEDIRLDMPSLGRYLEENHTDIAFMTTQVGRQFAVSPFRPACIKTISVGGEKLAPMAPPEGVDLYNGYGPSECTIFVTIKKVDKEYFRIPIGRSVAGAALYVVDEKGHRMPPCVPGELWVAGPCVGGGYLNRPDLTEKVFIRNPFSDHPQYARIYRTGDIVRFLPNGDIDFIGRNDGQVKVRGFRIEMTEVESLIREFPGINDVTVQAFEDEASGEKFITAYVVSDNEIDVPVLKDFIRERKPVYMVPAVIMQIEQIPLNQNSKVNKRALPKPELKAGVGKGDACVAAPLNVLEQELKKIVADIVNTTEFGITDYLGNLGLTSISGIRLATDIYKRFNVQLSAQKLISEGSIKSIEDEILLKFLSKEEEMTGSHKGSAVEEKQIRQSCRLSFSQLGLYSEFKADPDSVQYNIPFILHFPQGISAEELDAAVRKVVEAHSYILCRFVSNKDNDIIQEAIPDFKLEIPYREMSREELETCKREFVRPFDLEKGPAVRFEIVKTDDSLTLLLDMHHLVSDGASMNLFFNQLCQALDGRVPEKETFNYYDFVANEHISQEAEDFFSSQMAEVEDATQLIPDVFEADLPHTERNVSVRTDIAAVKEFARHLGVTPAVVYLGACYIAFGRYVCEDTVAIATVSNGRSNLRLSNTMGMFVNTLPLVTMLEHNEKTADFLHRTAKVFSETIAHENYPFARIAGKYDFHPSVSYAYQIGVINEYRTNLGPVDIQALSLDKAKLPVSVFIEGTEDAAQIKVTYDSALFSNAMMLGLAESIENALGGLLTCERLSDISLTAEAQWRILDGYNRPWDLDYDKKDTAVTVFKRNVMLSPDKTAAVYKDKSFTYRELDELTDSLAAKLYQRACEVTGKKSLAEELVAILLPRNENVFILPLAAVKAGLAYEPLDPSYPKERLNFMVKDANCSLLLVDDSLTDLLDEFKGSMLTVNELYSMPEVSEKPVGPSPEDLFIMLYTSGSTGAPKGCQIEHGNLVAYAHGVHKDFYKREDRIAAYASFGFDVNMSDMFCTLLNGGTFYLIPEEIRMDIAALAAYFDKAGITALLLTTQVGVQFLQTYPTLKTLRMMVMGGEKLPAVDPSQISYTIVNGYGPTENCCGVSLFPIEAWEPNVPIGKPMSTIHGYVLDKTGHRLPAGAAGEYCLSGPQVSRGYLNRPEKTREAYESCPFDEFRMYHTGDIVRYRQNGDVEFVGRKDGQVKIRGFRIETKEVESVIRSFEEIRDVTVQAYDYEGGGKYLAAFVVSNVKVDTVKLAEYIKTQKPAYMVPAVIMQIEKIPLTINQKVDKKALPLPTMQKAAYVPPKGKTEEDFCSIFSSVLGIEKISAKEDFFDVGGSSILAMKVVIAAQKAGYNIVYNDVFSYPTARLMAGFITGGKDKDTEIDKIQRESNSQILPEIGRDGYDYSKINSLLSKNTVEAFLGGKRLPLNEVLLLGATGYLGSHVLHELLVNSDMRVFCVIRPGKEESGEERLKAVLQYYFEDDLLSLFKSRITVMEGDVTDPDLLMTFKAPSDDMTVINCAASVKHFARGKEIERANVESVGNLISWCKINKARLVHISTGSVAGAWELGMPFADYLFDEFRLYFGQVVDNNQYVHSKFMAERMIYEEMVEHGLRAKVLRMGNLAPREEDGLFQINYSSNNYMNTFRAFETIGMISYETLNTKVEFSPIDSLAKAVIALSKTPDECVCFIPLNPHRPLMGDVIRVLNEMGHIIEAVEPKEFEQALKRALLDEKKSQSAGSLIAYRNNDNIQEIGLDRCDNSYTVEILERLGFSWPETSASYIRQFLEKLEEKDFFGGSKA